MKKRTDKESNILIGYIGLVASIINLIFAFIRYGTSFMDIFKVTAVTNILALTIFLPLIIRSKKMQS